LSINANSATVNIVFTILIARLRQMTNHQGNSDPKTVIINFDGRSIRVPTGMSLGSALAQVGVWRLSSSLKYHQPQGISCMSGHCGRCLVRIDGLPNRQACRTPVREGMVVERQNTLPTGPLDPIYLAHKCAGFKMDHHHFLTNPHWLNAIFNKVVRRFSGLGKLPEHKITASHPPHISREVDHLVIGAGPAGMAAIKVLIDAGITTTWIDSESQPGGASTGYGNDIDASLMSNEKVEWLPDSVVLGWFEDKGFAVRTPGGIQLIKSRRTLLATGCVDAPASFSGNTLPGVLTPGGARKLFLLDGVKIPGPVLLQGESERMTLLEAALRQRDIEVIRADKIHAARGLLRLASVEIIRNGMMSKINMRKGILVSEEGRSPALEIYQQAGGEIRYDQQREVFLPAKTMIEESGIWIAGSAAGAETFEQSRASGRSAALAMLQSTSHEVATQASSCASRIHDSATVCACEDVSSRDIKKAIARGYSDIELLKRYTGLATGPCQGKSCLCGAARLLREAQVKPDSIAPIRFRTPIQPLSLGELAGDDDHE
jgi:sarcosine oxidase, subunit alpha